jgi:hypothetical protein
MLFTERLFDNFEKIKLCREMRCRQSKSSQKFILAPAGEVRADFFKIFSKKVLTIHRYRCIINIEIKKGSNQNDKE